MRLGGKVALVIAALFVTVALAYFQRRTGPTYPVKGVLELPGRSIAYKLRRSHAGDGPLIVELSDPAGSLKGVVFWRRYPTSESFTAVPLAREENGKLVGRIPHQPPAGKVEYYLKLEDDQISARLPASGTVVARFRGSVPAWLLLSHILAMFLGMFFATLAFFRGVAFGEPPSKAVMAATLLLVVGGLVFGPMVQKAAFGKYWTGWPVGHDLTDNKTALAILVWVPAAVACLKRKKWWKWGLVVGWIAMMSVFMIPHSLRGSQIDWEKLPGEYGAEVESS